MNEAPPGKRAPRPPRSSEGKPRRMDRQAIRLRHGFVRRGVDKLDPDLPKVTEILSKPQIKHAEAWYADHYIHVDDMLKRYKKLRFCPAFEPSAWVGGTNDRNHPELWKPGHWLWFLGNAIDG